MIDSSFIVLLIMYSHPSIETGRGIGRGRGCPKAIHMPKQRAVSIPTIAPRWLADWHSIPSVNTPRRGPPTTPKIVKLICGQYIYIYFSFDAFDPNYIILQILNYIYIPEVLSQNIERGKPGQCNSSQTWKPVICPRSH